MAPVEASSAGPSPQGNTTATHLMAGPAQALYDKLQRLSSLWRYKEEECEACRTCFTLNSGHPNDYPVPDPVIVEDQQQARCHGCGIAKFALSYFGHIINRKKLGPIKSFSIYIESDLDHTDMIMVDNRGMRKARIQMIKTTKPNDKDSWLQWLFPFGGPRRREAIPSYLKHAFEGVPISGYTGSDAAFEKIFSWFRSCATNHKSCGDHSTMPVLPTRVIDITKQGEMKLVDGNGIRSHYVCLSHRWIEDSKMPRCTLENINDLKRHIRWDWMTANFQQAIIFARRFSSWYSREFPGEGAIPYIWIDSLCIIQNSAEDWGKEAARMCSVYEGAVLTIAAAAGPDGCFAEAELTYKGLEVTNPQRPDPRLFLREALPKHDNPVEDIFNQEKQSQPSSLDLLTRGWVFQERLLSRRFVLFSPNEVMWECLEKSDCECGKLNKEKQLVRPGEADGYVYSFHHAMQNFVESKREQDPNCLIDPVPFKTSYHRSLNDRGEHRERNLRNWWRRLVETYTALDLTKETDRLPAIMGLATHFGKSINNDVYITGHFQGGLPLDLAWYTEAPFEDGERQATKSTPSWSWASCSTRVNMPREAGDLRVYPELISTTSLDNSPNPSASLVVVKIRCTVVTDLNEKAVGVGLALSKKYFPDKVTSHTTPAEDAMYIIMIKAHSVDSWILLHVEPIDKDGFDLYFRRLGMLALSPQLSSSSESSITDETMRGCFGTEVTREVILV
ncbi:Fc.00g065310.m01.CDS01 [Cosmosporella sp. VM-42]